MNDKSPSLKFTLFSVFCFSLLTSTQPAHAFLRNFAAEVSRATQGIEREVRRAVETLPADTQRDLQEAAKKAREAAEKIITHASPQIDALAAKFEQSLSEATQQASEATEGFIADASPRVDAVATEVEHVVSDAAAALSDTDSKAFEVPLVNAWSQFERDNPSNAEYYVKNVAGEYAESLFQMETENPELEKLRDPTLLYPSPREIAKEQLAFFASQFDKAAAKRLASEDPSSIEFVQIGEEFADHLRKTFPNILPYEVTSATKDSVIKTSLTFLGYRIL